MILASPTFQERSAPLVVPNCAAVPFVVWIGVVDGIAEFRSFT